MSFPINWAPLAPGSSLSVFGTPLTSLSPSTGLPIFSALTGLPIQVGPVCVPVPMVWPVSPLSWPDKTCPVTNLGA